MPGAVSEAGGELKQSDAAGDREDHIWMRCLSLICALIMAKPATNVGVAPFCRVDCTRTSWSTRPLISLVDVGAEVAPRSGARC